jgi:hypothetical protein
MGSWDITTTPKTHKADFKSAIPSIKKDEYPASWHLGFWTGCAATLIGFLLGLLLLMK